MERQMIMALTVDSQILTDRPIVSIKGTSRIYCNKYEKDGQEPELCKMIELRTKDIIQIELVYVDNNLNITQ